MKKLLALSLIFFLAANSAFAIYAPRAMGMGGAFTAIADDAYAAYWNPAGLAINPGVELSGSYQMTNRNTQIGDNAFALKGCFEVPMNPFAWIAGVGLVSMFAYQGAKYLGEEGVVKKGWGRGGNISEKEESMAEDVKEEEEQQIAETGEAKREPISRKEFAKSAAKKAGKTTIQVADKLAKVAVKEAARQTRHYYYAPRWYRPNYYEPNYWDDRYDYREKELTPQGKAQFALGISVMSDQNAILDQNTNWYSFSVASGWGEIAALGANFNVYDLKVPSLNVRGMGVGMDVGALLRISDALFFGATAKELLTTDIQWENGTVTRYQTSVNVGAGLNPIRQMTLCADVHNVFGQGGSDPTMHYGVEVRPVYGLALRAGLSDENKTAGIGVGVGQLIIDYAYLGGAFNRTQMVGVSWNI